MHDGPKPLFRRDIRWPNVILPSNDCSKWFLIDWDDAAMPPTHAAKHPESHPAAVFQDNHGAEVDIWGVGKLILYAREFLRHACYPPYIDDYWHADGRRADRNSKRGTKSDQAIHT